MNTLNSDVALQWSMNAFVQLRETRFSWGRAREQWAPGKPLSLLFAGYNGTRNTGADVRVEEMIRQVRHVLGEKNCETSVFTINPELTTGYFKKSKQVQLPEIFPQFLYQELGAYHGVIACEGSMFKSKFADALTTMMAGSLGLAAAEDKLSVGYGGEAGDMTPSMKRYVKKWCQDSFVICRNEESQAILSEMDIRNRVGTDTAWTFKPATPAQGKKRLKELGWDGKKKVMAICPINPFWWPVKPNLKKYLSKYLGLKSYEDTHYKSVYFHEYPESQKKKYDSYISAISKSVEAFASENNVFPLLIAHEKLDVHACIDIQQKLNQGPLGKVPILESAHCDMFQLVSVLRNCSLVLSSRYHAIVNSMPAKVPSCGITMDERIRNLMKDRRHPHLVLEADQEDLEEQTLAMLRRLWKEREQSALEIAENVPSQLKRMAQMGKDFLEEVAKVYPDFPQKKRFSSWRPYLPPLSKELKKLVEDHS